MSINLIGNLAFGATQPKPAVYTGSDLVAVSRIIGDETGRYSMEEKGAAYRHYREMVGGNGSFSIEQRKESASLVNDSSFMKKIKEVEDKFQELAKNNNTATGSGKGAKSSERMTQYIALIDSIPPEDLALNPDFDGVRERLVVQRELFRTLEAREAAGTYKPGTDIEDVTDSAARQALEMLKQINDVYKTQRTDMQKAEDIKPVLASIRERLGLDAEGNRTGGPSSGRWQDSVTLSPEAQRIIGGG